MERCIYCLEDKDDSGFAKREHVLPEAFGTFENNLTLIGVVCDACNQFFGDELELAFARDTPDGLERFTKGGKDPEEYKSLGARSSMTFRIDQGAFRGAQVVQRPVNGVLHVEPLPQVGFSATGEPPIDWFHLTALPSKEVAVSLYETGKKHIQLVSVVDHEMAFAQLRAIGLELAETLTTLPPEGTGTARIELLATLGDGVGRTLTKIALNYLASQCGSDVAMRADFNGARPRRSGRRNRARTAGRYPWTPQCR